MGGARRPPLTRFGSWLGVLPFFLFSGMFLIAPAIVLGYAVKAAERDDRERGI